MAIIDSTKYQVFGTTEDDEILTQGSGNLYFALAGNDLLEGNSGTGNNRLFGNQGQDELFASSEDVLHGNEGNDILDARGGSGGNILLGGQDNDRLFGGNNDLLFGGFGNDILFAGSGNTLTGGYGADQFWLVTSELPTSLNIVSDFRPEEDLLGFSLQGEIETISDLTFLQQNRDVLISYNAQEIALIRDIEESQLTADNILIVTDGTSLSTDVPPETEPVISPLAPTASESISLIPLATLNMGNEIVGTAMSGGDRKYLLVPNREEKQVAVFEISNPVNPILIERLNFETAVNAVAINQNGLVAVAVENENPTEDGQVIFFDADDLTELARIPVGAMPKSLSFTPDGNKLLVANEGKPNTSYIVDPVGSINIIELDFANGNLETIVNSVGFESFNDQREELIAAGVRIFGPNATVAQDLEPESIAISADGSQAFITLQENNAIAILDISSATITEIIPLPPRNYAQGLTAASPFSELVFFGDSLSDTGNLFEFTNGQAPPSPPYFNGRFSNGPIWVDYLSTSLGFTEADVSNFAIGGAQTGEGNIENILGRIETELPGLQDQIAQFTTQIGDGTADPNALYFLWAGANDFLLLPEDPQEAITNAVTNIANAVNELAMIGAENIVISNLPNLGLTPLSQTIGTVQEASQLTSAYNQALETSLLSLEQSLQAENPEFDLVLVDIFSGFEKIAANPTAFGFSNITDPFSLEAVAVTQPNLVDSFEQPSAPSDQYVFFDLVHPTTTTHEFVSKVFLESIIGTTLDTSDQDGGVNLSNFPLFGLRQPNGISAFEIAGENYYAIANEGKPRDYEAFSEVVQVQDLALDPESFPNSQELQSEDNLGNLEVSRLEGISDNPEVVIYDELYAFGGRSFSILDSEGNLIFDTGDDFERITASLVPELFNSDGTAESFDTRSNERGPTPKSIVTGQVEERVFAFIGLEGPGGVMVYDVTAPANAEFVEYINYPGGIAPDGLEFISADDSPTKEALLIVTNQLNGVTSLYQINPNFAQIESVDPVDPVNPSVENRRFIIPENRPTGIRVGKVNATDPLGDGLTFAIASGNLDLDGDGIPAFRINNQGEIFIADRNDLDFENSVFGNNTPAFNLGVTATDAAGKTGTGEITVELINQDSARRGRNVFRFDDLGDEANLLFNIESSNADFVNEVGVFIVDDDNGKIGNLTPEDGQSYLRAAFSRSEIISSAISKSPNGFNQADLNRIFSGETLADKSFGFYLIQNSTTKLALDALENGGSIPNVFFATNSNAEQFFRSSEIDESAFRLSWEDIPGSRGDNSFDDLILTVKTTSQQSQGNSNQSKSEVIDLTAWSQNEQVSVEFTAYREANFDNLIGFYQVDNSQGSIDNLNPNSANLDRRAYLSAAADRLVTNIGVVENRATATVPAQQLQGGSLITPFILANFSSDITSGNVDDFQELIKNNLTRFTDGNISNGEIYFSYLGANSDRHDHVRLLADNTFGFEDLPNGGDNSYNDMIIQATFA